jgi:ABC-2 type transport system ATP-binding protein
VSVPVAHRVTALTEVVGAVSEAGVAVDDIGLRRPTLDDVFLELTGRRTDQADDEPRRDDQNAATRTEVAA